MAESFKRHHFDVDDYYRLADIGVLPAERRTELIYGAILDMTPRSMLHGSVVMRLTDIFVSRFRDRAWVSVQAALILRPDCAPQPDIMLLRRREDAYAVHEAMPESDVLLIIEVADSSLRFDRRLKARMYAQRGIGEYWIVDVNARRVLVYRDPTSAEYRSLSEWRDGALAPLAFPERAIDHDDIFGSPQGRA